MSRIKIKKFQTCDICHVEREVEVALPALDLPMYTDEGSWGGRCTTMCRLAVCDYCMEDLRDLLDTKYATREENGERICYKKEDEECARKSAENGTPTLTQPNVRRWLKKLISRSKRAEDPLMDKWQRLEE